MHLQGALHVEINPIRRYRLENQEGISGLEVIGVEWDSCFQDTISNREQFMHGCSCNEHLRRCPLCQAITKGTNNRIVMPGHHSRHIQNSSQSWSTLFGKAGFLMYGGARFLALWIQSRKGSQLLRIVEVGYIA